MRKALFLLAALAIVLSACRAEINIAVDVSETGETVVTVEMGADEEFQALFGGEDPSELLGESGLDLVPEGEAFTRTEGDMTYWGAQRTYSSFEEFEADFADPDDPDSAFTSLSFAMDENEAVLEGTLAAPDDEISTEGLPIDPSVLTADIFAVNFIFDMPGSVKEHNADRVLGEGQLLWEIPIVGGEKEIFARSSLGDSSLWWVWIILGVLLILLVAATIGVVMASRRKTDKALAAADEEGTDGAVVKSTDGADGDPSDGDKGQ